MQAGDTFLLQDKSIDSHLWVVVSDPALDAESVLIVNLTTHNVDKEGVCLVERSEHPFVRHRSDVNYRDSKVVRASDLTAMLATGHLMEQEPVSTKLLHRIREGAARSMWIPQGHRKVLIDQSLIEP